MLKSKKSLLLIAVFIVVLFFVVLIVINCSVNKNYQPDSDRGFYRSEYLLYSNGKLTVRNPDDITFDTYNLDDNKKTTVKCSDASGYYTEAIGAYIIYNDNGLTVFDGNTNTAQNVTTSYDRFVLDYYSIFYTNDGNLYRYDINSDCNSLIAEKLSDKVKSMYVKNDYLYIFHEKNHCYAVTAFDTKTNTQTGNFEINNGISDYYDYQDLSVRISDEQIIAHKAPFSYDDIYFYNFDGSKFINEKYNKLYESIHPTLEHSVYNGKYMYYILRDRTDSIVYDKTISNGDNGLYCANIETGEIKKLSDECEFDDILVTDNYIYCYKINYLIPKSVIYAKDFTTGYKIIQIPIRWC